MKKALALAITFMVSLALFGCAGEPDSASMAGTYHIESISDGTTEYTTEQISTLGMSDLITMEIGDDNTGTISVFGTDFDIAINPAEGQVTITKDDDPQTVDCTLDGDMITFEVNGQSLTMAKQ